MKFGVREFEFRSGQPCVVIAEVGVNHNGDPDIARQLIDKAVQAQVDVVKFQSFISEKEISRYASKAPYQQETTSAEGTQLEMCKALELSGEVLNEMQHYCAAKNIGFLCTAFESDSVDLLVDRLGVEAIKIPSGELTNLPLLEYIGSRCQAAILSTGASTLGEVALAIEALRRGGCEELMLLHCVTSYPAVVSDVNLRAIGLAIKNVKRNNIKNAEVLESDLFENIKDKFSTILCNPPQTAGKKVCFDIIEQSKDHLLKNGLLQIVARHNKGGKMLSEKMEEVFGNVEVLGIKSGYRVYYSKL